MKLFLLLLAMSFNANAYTQEDLTMYYDRMKWLQYIKTVPRSSMTEDEYIMLLDARLKMMTYNIQFIQSIGGTK